MSIHILVLNYNRRDLLEQFLPSVCDAAKNAPVPCRVSVVDNASTDNSREWVTANLPQVGWFACSENRVLISYNAVVQKLDEEAVFLLNNDIRLEPDCIAPLWNMLMDHPEALCVSPRFVNLNGEYDGGRHEGGFRGIIPWSGPVYPGVETASQRAGYTLYSANALYRRKKFVELGGFHSIYLPLSWEDTDLGYRGWKRGWPSLYCPQSLIHHIHNASIKRVMSRYRFRVLGFRNAFLWFFSSFDSPRLRLRYWLLLLPSLLACVATGRFAQIHGWLLHFTRRGAAWEKRNEEQPTRVLSDEEILRRSRIDFEEPGSC